MRIGNDLGDELIEAFVIVVGHANAEAVLAKILNGSIEMAMGVVKKRFVVADKELEIANLRTVDGGEVDFAQHTAGDREPDAARSRIGGTNDVLGAVGPAWLDAGATGRFRRIKKLGHG